MKQYSLSICDDVFFTNHKGSIIANIKQAINMPSRRPRTNGGMDEQHCNTLHVLSFLKKEEDVNK